jgi:hypothetical protein
MIPEFLEQPEPTPVVDGGNASTVTPPFPFDVWDGGHALGSSNPSFDGGNAASMPVRAEGEC